MIIQTVFCAHGEIEEGMPKLTAAKEHSSAFVIQSQVWLLFDTIWYEVRCCGSVPLSFRSLARKAETRTVLRHALCSDTHCAQARTVPRHALCSDSRCAQTRTVLRHALCSNMHSAQTCTVLRHEPCSDTHCAQTVTVLIRRCYLTDSTCRWRSHPRVFLTTYPQQHS